MNEKFEINMYFDRDFLEELVLVAYIKTEDQNYLQASRDNSV
jgi:hypothetical protein